MSFEDLWRLLTTAVGSGMGTGVALYVFNRWADRPRLRFKIRDLGAHSVRDEPVLHFEVANGGRTPIALHPVVHIKGTEWNVGRRIWSPTFLVSWLGWEKVKRFNLCIAHPADRSVLRQVDWIYDVEEAADLRLDSHAGARSYRAHPRRPEELHFLVDFPVVEFRLEGRKRPRRLRFVGGAMGAPVGRMRHGLYWACYRCFNGFPGSNRGISMNQTDWQARRQARD